MSKWKVKPLDRAYAGDHLQGRAHHLQSSLLWYDFIKDFSGEKDRSVTILREGEPVAYFCALQYRNLIQSLPYPASYSGLQVSPKLNTAQVGQVYKILFEHYSKFCDVVSICSSPCFEGHPIDTSVFNHCLETTIQVLDLKGDPLSRTTSKFRNNLQRNLRKAETAGVEIKLETGSENLDNWYICYEKRIQKLGGAQLPFAYFEKMFEHLRSADHCGLFSATARGRYLGGIVTVQNDHCLDYYLSMFDRDEDDTQASTAAFYFVMNYTRKQGIGLMNLQSSPRCQVDLIRFKQSWGAKPVPHHYLVKILNNKAAVLEQTISEIGKRYPFHFLVPFDALSSDTALV